MRNRRSAVSAIVLLSCMISGAPRAFAQPSEQPTGTLANPLEAQPLDRLSATRERPLFSPTRRPTPPPPPPPPEAAPVRCRARPLGHRGPFRSPPGAEEEVRPSAGRCAGGWAATEGLRPARDRRRTVGARRFARSVVRPGARQGHWRACQGPDEDARRRSGRAPARRAHCLTRRSPRAPRLTQGERVPYLSSRCRA